MKTIDEKWEEFKKQNESNISFMSIIQSMESMQSIKQELKSIDEILTECTNNAKNNIELKEPFTVSESQYKAIKEFLERKYNGKIN